MHRFRRLVGHLAPTTGDASLRLSACAGVAAVADDPHSRASRPLPTDNELVVLNPDTNEYELSAVGRTLTFDQGLFLAIRSVELLQERHPGRVVCVGIAGPTGSGKTMLATRMATILGALVVDVASFVRIENVIDQNYEDPSVIDFAAMKDAVLKLKAGQSACVPQINFETKTRMASKTIEPPESKVVIVEGLYALNETVFPLLDVTIAINGGVHWDLIKRITRDVQLSRQTTKNVILHVTNVLFPMFKAFIEPDMERARMRIQSSYNPITAWTEPTYVCKAEYAKVKQYWDEFVSSLPPTRVTRKRISDMYLYPHGLREADMEDHRNWIRIRKVDGLFFIHFYNEMTEDMMNVRPGLNFEISVQTLSGLLSLGYQIGAIMHRTTETWDDADGTSVTLEHIQELETAFVQVKGSSRADVLAKASRLHVHEHHIRPTFLVLYLRKFPRERAEDSARLRHQAARMQQADG